MRNKKIEWPKKAIYWQENGDLYVSVPFTWELPKVKKKIGFYKRVHVGGPAVDLMPHYFDDCENIVECGGKLPGVLQKINPNATRTTTGCVRKCKFCGIGSGKIEPGGLVELNDWPDLPIITDNNLLAASLPHFDKVMDRLEKHTEIDVNQGIDARLLTDYHAGRLSRLKWRNRGIRLALDNMAYSDILGVAFQRLREAGVAKNKISSYAIVGFDSDPGEAWDRCRWIESHGVRALPMWFHTLNALELNKTTEEQIKLGWNDIERQRIMGWYYFHREGIDFQETKEISEIQTMAPWR